MSLSQVHRSLMYRTMKVLCKSLTMRTHRLTRLWVWTSKVAAAGTRTQIPHHLRQHGRGKGMQDMEERQGVLTGRIGPRGTQSETRGCKNGGQKKKKLQKKMGVKADEIRTHSDKGGMDFGEEGVSTKVNAKETNGGEASGARRRRRTTRKQ